MAKFQRYERTVTLRNGAKRKLSPKQIKHFGTPAQKAALKRKRSAAAASSHRSNAAARPRGPVARRAKPSKTVSRPRAKTGKKQHNRKNVGSIVTVNPASLAGILKKEFTKMAQRTKKKKAPARHRPAATPKKRRGNPGPAKHRRRPRTNPPRGGGMLGGGTIELVKQGLFAIGGAVGTRALTSVALGANNVGWIGIGANGAMAWLLGFIISKVVKGNAGKAVVLGGVIGTLLRIVEENTPVGAYVKQQLAGMGVYGDATFYVPLAETVNQQSRDSGNLAQPGVVQSIAAAAAARSAPAKAGMADGGGRYSSGGRYS